MKSIIIRELIDNMKNFRFIMLLIFSILLFSVNSIVFPEKYYQEQSLNAASKNKFFSSGLALKIFPKLSPLQFLAEGGDKFRHKEYHLSPGGNLRPLQDLAKPESGLPNIPELDWAFIIKIIFSLYVILMGYNTISGEKEHGTLGLILSNPLSRARLLLAKYCVLIITVCIPLLIGMTLNLIIIGNLMPEILTTTALSKLLIIICTSIVYLSIFAFLSLMISSLINQSSLVLLVLMVVWILFAISGDIAGIIAKKIKTVPREIDIAMEFSNNYIFDDLDEFRRRAERGEFTSKETLLREHEQIYINGQQNYNRHIDNYLNAINHRIKFAHNLSRFSPTALFQFASENIAGTGLSQEENFLDEIKGYSVIYDNFIMSKIGTLPLVYNFVGPRFSITINGEKISLMTPRRAKRNFEDEAVPVFRESDPSFIRTLHDALLDLSGLLLWNLVLAMGAFLAFNRADVR